MRSNPNSKRGQVRSALKSGGESAALETGERLGIPEVKVRRWIRKFSAASAPRTVASTGKRQVRLTYDHDAIGYVDAEGPEVSAVKFNDGTRRFIPNQHIAGVGEQRRNRAS